MLDEPVTVRKLRLRHPDFVFHVDVTLTEHEGRWLATDARRRARHRDSAPREALRAALAALGEPYVSDLAASAELA